MTKPTDIGVDPEWDLQRGISTNSLAAGIDGSAGAIRVHLSKRGSYFGVKPQKLPNGRLLWPPDTIKRLLDIGSKTQHRKMPSPRRRARQSTAATSDLEANKAGGA